MLLVHSLYLSRLEVCIIKNHAPPRGTLCQERQVKNGTGRKAMKNRQWREVTPVLVRGIPSPCYVLDTDLPLPDTIHFEAYVRIAIPRKITITGSCVNLYDLQGDDVITKIHGSCTRGMGVGSSQVRGKADTNQAAL